MALSRTSVNNFSTLNMQDLVDSFNLLHFQLEFPDSEILPGQLELMEKIARNSSQKIMYWNEQELIMKHIAFILDIVSLSGQSYDTFAERNLSGLVEGIEFGGIVDFLVARGEYEPRNPYFFIQEYKRFKMGAASDPQAQVLAEMLVAQVLNNEKIVYGCYIIGRYWYFVVCEGQDYIVSASFDSTTSASLIEIARIIRKIKNLYEIKLQLT